MAEIVLNQKERLALKALSHSLDPVVLLGSGGLTEPVLKEIARALTDHELIKVRVPGDDSEERARLFAEIAEKLGAARVSSIGKILVFWRPSPEKQKADAEKARRRELAMNKKRRPGEPTAAKRLRAGALGRKTKRGALQ